MRTRPLVALALAGLLAAPALAMPRQSDDSLAFVPVSNRAARVESVAPDVQATRRISILPSMPISAQPVRSYVAVPAPHLIVEVRPTGGHSGIRRGVASRMGSGFGHSYLALPEGKGHRVRICGAARCSTMTSTDAGPSLAMQRAGRVCDMNDWAWAYVTGLPLSRGLAKVSVTYL